MPVRFHADADFNRIIVTAVIRRFPEVDFRTASAAGLARLQDVAVLTMAAHDGRILVTHDQSTMPTHFGEFIRTNSSPGDQVHVIRHKVLVEGRSQRQVTKEFGISRVTVRKYTEEAVPIRKESGPRDLGNLAQNARFPHSHKPSFSFSDEENVE